MTIETVVGDIDFAAAKPFCVRWLPFQNRVPLLEPVKFFGHARPEGFRIAASFGAQAFRVPPST